MYFFLVTLYFIILHYVNKMNYFFLNNVEIFFEACMIFIMRRKEFK